ncbi:MAG: site-specific integrase [Dehalogenimonas sp.]
MRYQYVQNDVFNASSAEKNARILSENLLERFGLRELLMALLDDIGKRRLEDQSKTNEQRFSEYDADLKISFQSTPRQLEYHRWLIAQFRSFLGPFPPTEPLAKQFLAGDRFSKLKPRSIDRYYRILKRFLERQCGITLTLTVQKTRSLPEEVENSEVVKLREAIAAKKTHRDTIERDLLLIDTACLTGLRAAELGRLVVRNIQFENRLMNVKRGKGFKDRNIPVTDELLERLKLLMAGKKPDELIFGLDVRTISNKIGQWGRKSGTNLHAHALRHYSAERLRDSGADLDVIQDFLGHESPETTRAYMAQDQNRLREAVERRDNPNSATNEKQYEKAIPKTPESGDTKLADFPASAEKTQAPSYNQDLQSQNTTWDPAQISLDKEHFVESDRLMNEETLRRVISALKGSHTYALSDYASLMRYYQSMELEGSRFVVNGVRDSFDKFWMSFDKLFWFMKLEFEQDRKNGKNSLANFAPAGSKSKMDKGSIELIEHKIVELNDLTDECLCNYVAFRSQVRNDLII